MAAFMAITREQYNKSVPTVAAAGAPVGTYNLKYHIIDRDIGTKKYGTQQ